MPTDSDEPVTDEPVAVVARGLDEVTVVEVESEVAVEPLRADPLPAARVAEADVDPADGIVASYAEPDRPVEDAEPGPIVATQLDVLDVEPTGDPRVDDALDRVRDLAGLPTADHVEVYEDVHRRLQRALADLDPDD